MHLFQVHHSHCVGFDEMGYFCENLYVSLVVQIRLFYCIGYFVFIYFLAYTREGILFHKPIFCISWIRDGYTKWVRYRIIVEAAAVLLSILLIIDARHCRCVELGKQFLLFFWLQAQDIKCKRNSHQIQFSIY